MLGGSSFLWLNEPSVQDVEALTSPKKMINQKHWDMLVMSPYMAKDSFVTIVEMNGSNHSTFFAL